VLLVATILGAVLFGTTVASASEPLAPGDYTISLPGIGDLTVNVADSGAVNLAAVPAGYTVAAGDEPNKWRVVSAAGLAVLTVEVEDGEIEIEAETALAAGVHSVHVPGVGTVTFTVGTDGAVDPATVSAPAGFTVTIGSDDGRAVLTVASATITATITVEDEDDSCDAPRRCSPPPPSPSPSPPVPPPRRPPSAPPSTGPSPPARTRTRPPSTSPPAPDR